MTSLQNIQTNNKPSISKKKKKKINTKKISHGTKSKKRNREDRKKETTLPKTIKVILDQKTSSGFLATPIDPTLTGYKFILEQQHSQLKTQDIVLVLRQSSINDFTFKVRLLKKLHIQRTSKIFGVVQRSGKTLSLVPIDRKPAPSYYVTEKKQKISPGDFVEALIVRDKGRRGGAVKILDKLGNITDPKIISLIAIHKADIPLNFSQASLDQANNAKIPPLDSREDLRSIPLVTIDGDDAKDFDDAVWATPTKNGWYVIVAIADVAHYVKPGSPLDSDAYERGNSVYFPDRVVPMLPEALSNGVCSLKPQEDRACLAAHMWVDTNGQLKNFRFTRALMKSRARLTYNEAQDLSLNPDKDPTIWTILKPLFDVYTRLKKARELRGTLEIDLPERQIIFDNQGQVKEIQTRSRFDSHKLVEELMILANIAAAKALENHHFPTLFRVHDKPDPFKVQVLLDVLKTMNIRPKNRNGQNPIFFNKILEKIHDHPAQALVQDLVLRSQCQAMYQPHNIGHFGLSLEHYTHFTSPIRRYADLTVHRALISALGLGNDGWDDGHLKPEAIKGYLSELSDHLAVTERRAMKAEREVLNRYVIAYMEDKIGCQFDARISGVNQAGLFISLAETGAEGFLPKRNLPRDVYQLSETQPHLQGRKNNFMLGDSLRVCLEEANSLTNGMLFSYVP